MTMIEDSPRLIAMGKPTISIPANRTRRRIVMWRSGAQCLNRGGAEDSIDRDQGAEEQPEQRRHVENVVGDAECRRRELPDTNQQRVQGPEDDGAESQAEEPRSGCCYAPYPL